MKQEYVLGFMISKDNQVVLIKKEKPAWQKGLWNGVGGKIEENEKAIDAMTREFEEETGMSTSNDEWKIITVKDESDFKLFVFGSNPSLLKQDIDVKTMEEEVVRKIDYSYVSTLPLMTDVMEYVNAAKNIK